MEIVLVKLGKEELIKHRIRVKEEEPIEEEQARLKRVEVEKKEKKEKKKKHGKNGEKP
jgi:hypothetical protein